MTTAALEQPNRATSGEIRSGRSTFLNIVFAVSIFLLSAQGILNFAFKGTPLVVWKQLLVIILFAASLTSLRIGRDYVLRASFLLIAILVVGSHFQAVDFQRIAQHILYYAGWIPFYIWGKTGQARTQKLETASFVFIIISGIGLILQLYTPYLNFLKDDIAAIQYQVKFGEAQRLALYFVASTVALPTLLAFFYFVSTGHQRNLRILVSLPFLAMATLPTGSVGAFSAFACCLVLAVYALRIPIGARVALFIVGALLSLFIYEYVLDLIDPLATAQIKRVLTNNQYSESNRGRFVLWGQAMQTIGGFDFIKHISGLGLGITVADRIGIATYMHGESSFFQAYIEGGITALTLRSLPFSVILYYAIMRKNLALLIVFLSSVFSCAVAPVFGSFGIECTLGLIAGMAKFERVAE
jgi:hypothetical protein